MTDEENTSISESMTIQLEITPEDDQQIDIADLDEVTRSFFEQLGANGYSVTPVSTGRKGGGTLFTILLQIPPFIYTNKDWLLQCIPTFIDCLLRVREKRAEKEHAKRAPIKITLEIAAEQHVTIEINNPQDAIKLIEQLKKNSTKEVKKTSGQPQIKVKVRVPPRKRHRTH